MTPEEILRLLRLDESPSAGLAEATFEIDEVTEGVAVPEPSPYALHLDRWDLWQGETLARDNPAFDGLPPEAAADFLGVAFLARPVTVDRCTDPPRLAYVAALLDAPPFRSIRARTRGNLDEAHIAAEAIARGYPRTAPEALEVEVEAAMSRAAATAAEAAEADVRKHLEIVEGFGMGPGAPGGRYDRAAAARLYHLAKRHPAIRRICELSGVFYRVGRARRMRRVRHGVDDVMGVTLGGDFDRLLPGELVSLRIPGLAEQTRLRLMERKCLQLEREGVEPAAKGPAIYVVDESGSMAGSKIETAKALCLAMARISCEQRRWCGLVAYSGDSGHRLISLKPGAWPMDLVADWMGRFIGRGSDLDVPVWEMPAFYDALGAPTGKTDVVFITDAICRIPPKARDSFLAWKKRVRANVTTLIVQSQPGDLAAISDRVYAVPALEADSEGVGAVLEI